jgi:uncharacterized membrane protein YkgB
MSINTKVQYKIDPETGKITDTKWGEQKWESEKGSVDWSTAIGILIVLAVVGIISGIASFF